MISRGLTRAKLVLPLILAYFIGRSIYGNWEQVRAESWRLDPAWLALSAALAAAWYLVRPLGWTLLLRGFGPDLPYAEIYRVYRKSELSRYVPGGIWQFAARIYLTQRYGVGAAACLAATLLDMTLAALAAMIPAAWVAAAAHESLGPWQRLAVLAFPAFASVLVIPRVLNAWAGPLARLLKQPYQPLEIGAARMFAIWGMYVATWTSLALAAGCFARALLPGIDSDVLLYIAGCYALAWLAALLTIVSPAGMGIREGLLGLLLGQALAVGTAMTLAVAIRLWVVCLELGWLGVGYLMPRRPCAAAD